MTDNAIFGHAISQPPEQGGKRLWPSRGGPEAQPPSSGTESPAFRATDLRAPFRDAGRVEGNQVQDGADKGSDLADQLFQSRQQLARALANHRHSASNRSGNSHGKEPRYDQSLGWSHQMTPKDLGLLIGVGVFAFGVFTVLMH